MAKRKWTFLSNHGLIFTYLAKHPQTTTQSLAYKIGLSIRAVQVIIDDLEQEGYLTREKVGRCTRYIIYRDLPMRHRLEGRSTANRLLEILSPREKKEVATIKN